MCIKMYRPYEKKARMGMYRACVKTPVIQSRISRILTAQILKNVGAVKHKLLKNSRNSAAK